MLFGVLFLLQAPLQSQIIEKEAKNTFAYNLPKSSQIKVQNDTVIFNLFVDEIGLETRIIENIGQTLLTWTAAFSSQVSSTVFFEKGDYVDWLLPENQDSIAPAVKITRANQQGIFNISVEEIYDYSSPAGTKWAKGLTNEVNVHDYVYWRDAVQGPRDNLVGEPYSLHLLEDDVYYDVVFHSWTSGGNGGGFSYTRMLPPPTWLELLPTEGMIEPGGEQKLFIMVNTQNLLGGIYNEGIVVKSNGLPNADVLIPVILNVTGIPEIKIDTNQFSFSESFVDNPDSIQIVIKNIGSDDLIVSDIISSNAKFYTKTKSLTIKPSEFKGVNVFYLSDTISTDSAEITIISNAKRLPEIKLQVVAKSMQPPVLSISDDTVGVELHTGETEMYKLVVSNTGKSDLNWHLLASNNAMVELDIVPLDVGRTWKYKLTYEGHDFFEESIKVDSIYNVITIDEQLYYLVNSEYFGIANKKASPLEEPSKYLWDLAWSIDEKGDFYLAYISGDYVDKYKIMVAEPYVGYEWSVLENKFKIVDKIDVNAEGVLYKGCWKVELAVENYKECWYYKKGIGIVKTERFYDGGAYYESSVLMEFNEPITWLDLSLVNATTKAGTETSVDMLFSAIGMYEGEYFGYLVFDNNDPKNHLKALVAKLNVIGVSNIAADQKIDFGTTYIGYPDTLKYVIKNEGSIDLLITDFEFTDNQFTSSVSSLTIHAFDEKEIEIICNPVSEALSESSMTIMSNAHNTPSLTVMLSSEMMYPPKITYTPTEFSSNIEQGQSASFNINISNTGESMLDWNISLIGKKDYNSFKPLQKSNNWTYRVQENYDGELVSTYYEKEIIYEEKWYNDNQYFTFDWQYVDAKHSFAETKQQNDDYWLGYRVDDENNVYEVYYENWGDNEYLWEIKLMIGNPAIHEGWQPSDDDYRYFEIAGISNVETPAGLFNNCWEVLNLQYYDEEYYYYNLWYWKKGVGLVKVEQFEGGYDGNGMPTWSFYRTKELSDYALKRPAWINCNSYAGSVDVGGSKSVTVNIATNNVNMSDYEAFVKIETNDPETPLVLIPVNIELDTEIRFAKDFNVVKVYPNPAQHEFVIEFELNNRVNYEILITDVYGRIVDEYSKKQASAFNTITVNSVNYKSGVYFVHLKTKYNTYVNSIIIK